MSDLISRAGLFNRLATVQTLAEAYAVIQGMPTADDGCATCRYAQRMPGIYPCSGCEDKSAWERKGEKGETD